MAWKNHYLARYNQQQLNDSEDEDEDEPANNYK